jgi:uncharacterized protein (UPF0210 family)
MKVRTLTTGLAIDADCAGLATAMDRVAEAAGEFKAAGYEVQTVRIATQPIDQVVGHDPAALRDVAARIHATACERGIEFVSLGPFNSRTSLDLVDAGATALAQHPTLNASLMLDRGGHVDVDAPRAAADTISRLARETPGGIGNFRFAAIAACPAGIPFFPAAYHDAGPPALSIGLQSADVVEAAFRTSSGLNDAARRLAEALDTALKPVADLGTHVAASLGWRYLGLDVSPAPLGDVSIARAFEHLGFGPFGSPGTLASAAMATQTLTRLSVQRCGFSGLMFPVLEDSVLGRRNTAGAFDIQDLLLYSAVCGTGLDTVPIPGDAPRPQIARLLLDVASLALRLGKPLSARLFPVPGKGAGEMTAFDSPYLTNTTVMALASPSGAQAPPTG